MDPNINNYNYNYNYNENLYNLISYEKKIDVKKPEFVRVYTYEKNKDVKNYEKRPFINTNAYDKIKNTTEKVLLINNNDLQEKTVNNDSKYKNKYKKENKYFMLINIDGNKNGRRYNIIPFNKTLEDPNIDKIIKENSDMDEIKKIPGGQMIPNTFYIIKTFF